MHCPLEPKRNWLVTLIRRAWHGFWVSPSRLHFNAMLPASVIEPTMLERDQLYPSSSIILPRAVPETGLSDETWYAGCTVACGTWDSRETFWSAELLFVVSMGPNMSGSSKGLSFTWCPAQEVLCKYSELNASALLLCLRFLNVSAINWGGDCFTEALIIFPSVFLYRHKIHREADKRNYN